MRMEEKLGRRFRGMCPWRPKTPQPLTNRSSTLGWEGGGGRALQCSSIASLPKHCSLSLLLSLHWRVWMRIFSKFHSKNLRLDVDVYHMHPGDSSETCRELTFSVLRGGSCVCFNVLMDNRQMKGTYSTVAVYVRMRWCSTACGFSPSQCRAPPSAYFVVIVLDDWWLWLNGCQAEWVGSDAQGVGSSRPALP